MRLFCLNFHSSECDDMEFYILANNVKEAECMARRRLDDDVAWEWTTSEFWVTDRKHPAVIAQR